MRLSIIIPTYNEAPRIGQLVHYLQQCTNAPIYIANSPATTNLTSTVAREAGAKYWNVQHQAVHSK